jgi:hypothetical protein
MGECFLDDLEILIYSRNSLVYMETDSSLFCLQKPPLLPIFHSALLCL